MLSSITITFLSDFNVGYKLKLATDANETFTIREWDWVNSRSGGFEVTDGTDANTTAQNFKSAFDLDLPTGYNTTINNNAVTINSETNGEEFIAVGIVNEFGFGLLEGSVHTVTFGNYIPPLDLLTVNKIMARSPHYVNIPFYLDTTTGATVKLKIYSGHFTNDEPSEFTQEITKVRPSIDFPEFNANISDTVSNFLESVPDVDLLNTVNPNNNEVKWVRLKATYNNDEEDLTDINIYSVGVDGYGFYREGVNPSFNGVLTDVSRRKVSRNGIINIPFINDGTFDEVITSGLPNFTNVTTEDIFSSEESTNFVSYIRVDPSLYATEKQVSVVLVKPNNDRVTLFFDLIDECRYTPKTILFKNKYGFFDVVTMFAKSTEKLNTERDEFTNNYINNGSYNINRHQFRSLNVTGKKSITCNSGFVKEIENDLFEQLLLSEYVWFYENGGLNPVKVMQNEFTYKTRVNDGLIEYEVNFEYAYNLINNV